MDKEVTGDFLALGYPAGAAFSGEVTGKITTVDLLVNMFGKFCIGK